MMWRLIVIGWITWTVVSVVILLYWRGDVVGQLGYSIGVALPIFILFYGGRWVNRKIWASRAPSTAKSLFKSAMWKLGKAVK